MSHKSVKIVPLFTTSRGNNNNNNTNNSAMQKAITGAMTNKKSVAAAYSAVTITGNSKKISPPPLQLSKTFNKRPSSPSNSEWWKNRQLGVRTIASSSSSSSSSNPSYSNAFSTAQEKQQQEPFFISSPSFFAQKTSKPTTSGGGNKSKLARLSATLNIQEQQFFSEQEQRERFLPSTISSSLTSSSSSAVIPVALDHRHNMKVLVDTSDSTLSRTITSKKDLLLLPNLFQNFAQQRLDRDEKCLFEENNNNSSVAIGERIIRECFRAKQQLSNENECFLPSNHCSIISSSNNSNNNSDQQSNKKKTSKKSNNNNNNNNASASCFPPVISEADIPLSRIAEMTFDPWHSSSHLIDNQLLREKSPTFQKCVDHIVDFFGGPKRFQVNDTRINYYRDDFWKPLHFDKGAVPGKGKFAPNQNFVINASFGTKERLICFEAAPTDAEWRAVKDLQRLKELHSLRLQVNEEKKRFAVAAAEEKKKNNHTSSKKNKGKSSSSSFSSATSSATTNTTEPIKSESYVKYYDQAIKALMNNSKKKRISFVASPNSAMAFSIQNVDFKHGVLPLPQEEQNSDEFRITCTVWGMLKSLE